MLNDDPLPVELDVPVTVFEPVMLAAVLEMPTEAVADGVPDAALPPEPLGAPTTPAV